MVQLGNAFGHRQKVQVVIAQDGDGAVAQRPDEAQHFQRIRPAIDQVTHQPEFVVRRIKTHGFQQLPEFSSAPLYVADGVGRHILFLAPNLYNADFNEFPLLQAEMRTEFTRFLLVGATNTLFSYLLYLLLLLAMSPQLAYTLSYAAGIVLSYFLNVHFVFRKKPSLASFLKFPFVYLLQYGVGLLVLTLLIGFGIDPRLAMAGVIIVTIPVTFLASRFVLKR